MHAGQTIDLHVVDLGGEGDGVAFHEGKAVFIPYACPGDRVTARITSVKPDFCRAVLETVTEPSGKRQAPPCPHFGACGGCSLQHVSEEEYAAFKRRTLVRIVRNLGADEALVAPPVLVGPGKRRRVECHVAVEKGRVRMGFYAPESRRIVDVSVCPVAAEPIAASLPAWRAALERLKKPGNVASVHLTALEEGIDALVALKIPLPSADAEALAAFAGASGMLRLCTQTADAPETLKRLHLRAQPYATFGGAGVALPPGAFLQAAKEGEEAILAVVLERTKGCRRVVDLYSGCGSYSFPLAQQAEETSAYEGAPDMAAALHNAIRKHGLEGRLSAHCRDLFVSPLSAEELGRFDAAVVNPPRNGAEPQTRQLANSGVGTIVMVSCNPASFARDAAVLLAAGFRMTCAVPVDQFHWSAHLEVVAAFVR
jgi:23S rRNA (uracil1939-C5)-methyltransferase